MIVWSDEFTRFQGEISGKGGAEGGDGGFAEVSGKANLEFMGSVNMSAENGDGGTLLLDPRNVSIVTADYNGAFDSGDPKTFTPTGDNSTANRDTIQTTLNLGTDVTINTGIDGAQDGDIDVDATISTTSAAGATLTLTAADDVRINQTITATNSALNLTIIALDGNTGDGTDNVEIDAAVDLNGGTLDITASGAITQTGTITATNLAVDNTGGATTLTQNNVVANLSASDFSGQTAKITVSGALDIDGVTRSPPCPLAGIQVQ